MINDRSIHKLILQIYLTVSKSHLCGRMITGSCLPGKLRITKDGNWWTILDSQIRKHLLVSTFRRRFV